MTRRTAFMDVLAWSRPCVPGADRVDDPFSVPVRSVCWCFVEKFCTCRRRGCGPVIPWACGFRLALVPGRCGLCKVSLGVFLLSSFLEDRERSLLTLL